MKFMIKIKTLEIRLEKVRCINTEVSNYKNIVRTHIQLKNMFKLVVIPVLLLVLVQFHPICGHGMLMDPVNRASRWRFNSSAPQDWTDNEGYCGGISVSNLIMYTD